MATNNDFPSLSEASKKRLRTEVMEDEVDGEMFVVAHAKGDVSLGTLNPFLLQKSLTAVAGELKSVKKLRNGDLLVTSVSRKQAQRLIKCEKLGGYEVSFEYHKTLNSCRGVISVEELVGMSEEDILEEFKIYDVTAVRRINIRKDGVYVPTRNLILTFSKNRLPASIKAGYLNCPVRPYIPSPLRCFKCQKFGHSKLACRGSLVCARCSEKDHESENCKNDKKCVNCGEGHEAYSRSCPKWKEEKLVQEYKIKNNVTYFEARKYFQSSSVFPKSFSSVTKQIPTSNITQSEPVKGQQQPDLLSALSPDLIQTLVDLLLALQRSFVGQSAVPTAPDAFKVPVVTRPSGGLPSLPAGGRGRSLAPAAALGAIPRSGTFVSSAGGAKQAATPPSVNTFKLSTKPSTINVNASGDTKVRSQSVSEDRERSGSSSSMETESVEGSQLGQVDLKAGKNLENENDGKLKAVRRKDKEKITFKNT
jgi:hypothetical protein